jgi:hypothetical protein
MKIVEQDNVEERRESTKVDEQVQGPIRGMRRIRRMIV